jgi:cholest-4-en-3-one 26-monooxygenase
MNFSADTIDIIGPDHYQKNGYPHAEWAWLRRNKPVCYIERPNVDPFWAVTKAADIIAISCKPAQWINHPRLAVFPFEGGTPPEALPLKHLLNMDPPEHGDFRALVSRGFTPRAVRALQPQIERITREVLDEAMDRTECDFVTEISSRVPIAVIAELLGVPREDWTRMFRWTNELIGGGDPEFQTAGDDTGRQAQLEVFQYFSSLADERRKKPTDDITSLLANCMVGGAPLSAIELLSYLLVLVVAGNETTRNATTGGLLALIEHQDQFRRLKSYPSMLNTAIEEMVRWTSPVIQFSRTATQDTEVHGEKISAGQSVCMFYPSANRDEDVFENPNTFDIGRNPNPHIAFGIGEHFCLGSNLARLELEVIFRQLCERLESAEQTGPVERLRSSFVGGIKHMPIRYKLSAARN